MNIRHDLCPYDCTKCWTHCFYSLIFICGKLNMVSTLTKICLNIILNTCPSILPYTVMLNLKTLFPAFKLLHTLVLWLVYSKDLLIFFSATYVCLFPSLSLVSFYFPPLFLSLDSDQTGACPYSAARAVSAFGKVQSRAASERVRGKYGKHAGRGNTVAISPIAMFLPLY